MRNRDQLLSLKYSTIEACFSVPFLNLTMPNLPFVLAFAVRGLGWQAATVGLMAALPHVCNCLQPLLLAGLARRLSAYRLLIVMFVLGAVPWGLAALLPLLGPARDLLFAGMLLLATFANSVASVAWSSAISEVVPERIGGRYFARRNLIFGAWTLVAVMAVGQIVEWQGNSLQAFCVVFCVATASRFVGLFFLTRMKFPPPVKQVQPRGLALRDLAVVLRDRNYLWLMAFIGLWGLLLNAAMPFYTVYLVDELSLGIGTVVKLTTLASLGGLVTLKGWGRLCDRFGNRPVLQVAALLWGGVAMVMWAFAGRTWLPCLFVGYFVVGSATAGFQLVQFNLMVRLAPAALRPVYVAVFLAVTSLLTALGPMLGGAVLKLLPVHLGQIAGQPILSYHALFVAGALGCLIATQLIERVREPAQQPLASVWREMKSMRAFNPMLSMLAVGELLLTPRGLLALARKSLRSVRQQVRALEDVGGTLVEGGKEMLNPPVPRKRES